MLVLSHRGLHQNLPENTMPAFDAAVRLGVDGIETDLRVTVDGEILLYHDRHAPSGQAISALRRDELSRQVGYEPPTLAEALTAFPSIFWNLEIKDFRRLDVLADGIGPYVGRQRLLVTSFHHPSVIEIRRRLGVDIGFLVCSRPMDLEAAFGATLRDGVRAIVWNFEFVDDELLQQSAAIGLENFVYGPAGNDDHTLLRKLPLAGAITDEPGLLL